MTNQLPEGIVRALRLANDSLIQSSDAIRTAYEEAEISGDYSDADELAADYREHLHDELDVLLGVFTAEYPGLFREV